MESKNSDLNSSDVKILDPLPLLLQKFILSFFTEFAIGQQASGRCDGDPVGAPAGGDPDEAGWVNNLPPIPEPDR